ncbi:MAG TPA: hypothetical protein VHI52_06135, partial [Verrucomicrobiae bacterium]|nr:hypothetical protein [Verrucomicrobiae bacterium]
MKCHFLKVIIISIGVLHFCLGVPGVATAAVPQLHLASLTNGNLVLSWPLTGDFYALEATSNLSDSNTWSSSALVPSAGPSQFSLSVPLTSGSRFFRLRHTFQPAPATVPSPETIAPPLPTTGFPTFADSTAFLYSGPDPVQLGVAAGVLDPGRTGVLRGRLITREGQPILGVLVSVLNHPEFGFTYTRADGMFDLAVNGGAVVVLEFQRLGFCAAQRPVSAPQQDFRTIRDVALVPLDPVATAISFGSNAQAQVATSSLQTDDAGSRSTTLFFPAGTVAALGLADGSTQMPPVLTIHATEYTVGTNGLAAMPGALPPTSEYTYCVNFDAEEALQAGAQSIRFNQPVAVYQDNFLGVPIGTLVPNGYYDHERAAWVPEDNGIVLRILSATNGLASLDLQGNGQPADPATLSAYRFTDPELRYLASTYSAGTSLWRSLTWHFSDRDPNFGRGTSDPARPNRPGDDPNPEKDDGMGNLGVVGLMNQDFSETIPLVGAPMALHYSSQRVPGHKQGSSKFTLRVYDAPGINFTFLYNLDVEVEVEVAGKVSTAELGTRVDESLDYTFEWDGRDAYGRFIGGTHDAFVRVTIFPVGNPDSGGYRIAGAGLADPAAAQAQSLFANYGDVRFTGFHIGPRIGREYDFTRQVTLPDERKVGLGGWSLTPHHLLDIRAGVLYKGDGTIQRAEGIGSGRPSLVDGIPVLIAAASGNTAILYTA